MIRVHNLSKTFDIPHEKKITLKEHLLGLVRGTGSGTEPLRALKGVSFDVAKGEFFSIIGKNGSGKSTLLKIMAGIYAPDRGGVAIDGTISPFLELGVGFNPNLTARENVFLSGAVMGLRRREIEALYDNIIGFSELEKFQDQALKNFSSGMKVRLAFSVAFQVDADILLIDEVLAVGDASFRQKCYDVFGKLIAAGKTIVFVSHSMGDVENFSDRVMLLHEGEMVSIGDPEKVVHDYQLLTAHEDERRMAREERVRKEGEKKASFVPPEDTRRWGSGGARITGISLLDGEGRDAHVFATGQEAVLRIGYEVRDRALEEMKATAAIRRSDGVIAFTTESELFAVGPGAGKRRGVIELAFPELDLLAATYYVNVGLRPAKSKEEPLDFMKECCTLRVYQDEESRFHKARGVSFIEHEWREGESSK